MTGALPGLPCVNLAGWCEVLAGIACPPPHTTHLRLHRGTAITLMIYERKCHFSVYCSPGVILLNERDVFFFSRNWRDKGSSHRGELLTGPFLSPCGLGRATVQWVNSSHCWMLLELHLRLSVSLLMSSHGLPSSPLSPTTPISLLPRDRH